MVVVLLMDLYVAVVVVVCSLQVSYDFAAILQEFDFTCNSMGGETRLDIATYNFTGGCTG